MSHLIGRVIRITRSTTGYGENERGVGVDVQIEFTFSDQTGDYRKTTEIHIPKELRQPRIGDTLMLTITGEDEVKVDDTFPDEPPPGAEEDLELSLAEPSISPEEAAEDAEARAMGDPNFEENR